MPIRALHFAFAAGAFAVLAMPSPALADMGAVYVVPSRPGVPIAINGRDASWSVVEGDVGLARPGHLTPVIIGGGRPLPPRWSYHRNPYFPRYGSPPPRGRNENDPGLDRAPEPAESFHRSWSTSSDLRTPRPTEPSDEVEARQTSQRGWGETVPATIDNGRPPFTPPIVVVPQRGRR